MKREKKKNIKKRYKYSSKFPLFFWKECDCCEKEICREKIHKLIIRWNKKSIKSDSREVVYSLKEGVMLKDKIYLCFTCANNKEKAMEYFKENIFLRYFIKS